MRGFHELSFTSTVARPTEALWRELTRLDAINRELPPFLTVHCPEDCRELDGVLARIGRGAPPFTARLLLFGFLPVTWWKPEFIEYETGRFVERSSMPLLTEWRHERMLREVPGGCEIIDRIGFRPRLPGTTALLEAMIALLFRYRHRRLASHWSAAGSQHLPRRIHAC